MAHLKKTKKKKKFEKEQHARNGCSQPKVDKGSTRGALEEGGCPGDSVCSMVSIESTCEDEPSPIWYRRYNATNATSNTPLARGCLAACTSLLYTDFRGGMYTGGMLLLGKCVASRPRASTP